MTDGGPILLGLVLFIFFSPGLLFRLPGTERHMEFGGLRTHGKAIAIHTLIFFVVYTIMILALRITIYTR